MTVDVTLQPVELTLEALKTYQYILLEPAFFTDVHHLLGQLGLTYEMLATNAFSDKHLAPLLVEIAGLDDTKLQPLYDRIMVDIAQSDSVFNRMHMAQNLIATDASTTDMVDMLQSMMVIDQPDGKYLFRFYDPRVGIHLQAILGNKDIKGRPKGYTKIEAQWRKHIKHWDVSVAGGFYRLNYPTPLPLTQTYTFDEVHVWTEQMQAALMLRYDDDLEEIKPTQTFLELYSDIYAQLKYNEPQIKQHGE